MYKVFFNRTEFQIIDEQEFMRFNPYYVKLIRISRLPTEETLRSWLKEDREISYVLPVSSVKKTWKEFKSKFRIVVAAGGLVTNDNNELLTIFRNSMWDLPKGKVEEGEELVEAAKREVEEETGVKVDEVIIDLSWKTFHVYILKERIILKKTVWFFMKARSGNKAPQLEEGITEVKWMDKDHIMKVFNQNTYATTINLLDSAALPNYSSM